MELFTCWAELLLFLLVSSWVQEREDGLRKMKITSDLTTFHSNSWVLYYCGWVGLVSIRMFFFCGYINFRSGSTLAFSNGVSTIAAKITVNTVLAAGAAGAFGVLIKLCIPPFGKWDAGFLMNSLLAGLVGITAGW